MAKANFWHNRQIRKAFWNSRTGNIIEVLASVLLAYIVASFAINTGSLIQYFLTFLLVGIAISRLIKIFRK